jgi:hypothetical protein
VRTCIDTLEDIESMQTCLKREAEVLYAKGFYANLYEDAFKRVDADMKGVAAVLRTIQPNREELVSLLRVQVLIES